MNKRKRKIQGNFNIGFRKLLLKLLRLWSINYDASELIMRQTVEGNTHSSPITALCVTGVERQDTLLIGDRSGRISVCKTVQLDSYNPEELAKVVDELAGGIIK